ncbi:MAG: YbfB/YjiJ family MFS transporter [Pseudomonadota bacterium]
MQSRLASSKPTYLLALAAALSMGSAVALGLTRFSYGILLPVMREDLQWSYLVAGFVNTANAVGYLIGALVTPIFLRRFDPSRVLIAAAGASVVSMACTGLTTATTVIMLLRATAGVSSALAFISGGILAARLANSRPRSAGLFLGIYYGGTGFGIALAAVILPGVFAGAQASAHGWTWGWWVLSACCAVALWVLLWPARHLRQPETQTRAAHAANPDTAPVWRGFAWAIAAYFMFGVGNIGYMTFVIALLGRNNVAQDIISIFYGLLGCAAMAAPRIWSPLLDRFKGGQPLAILNLLLGMATILPAVTSAPFLVLLSGAMFGGIFLSVVASTTALVRHNLAPSQWPAGITAFTAVFAAGQIIGPSVVGWIGDGPGGLPGGFVFSAISLWIAAALACLQRPLGRPPD